MRTGVAGIQFHGLEAIMLFQHRARPLPGAAHVPLTRKDVAIRSDGQGVKVLEANIAAFEVREKLRRVQMPCGTGPFLTRRV